MKPQRFLIIQWLDACERGDDNLSPSDVGTGTVLVSYGAFVKENKHILSIGMDYEPESGMWRRVSDIPKTLIQSRIEVSINIKKLA